MAYNFDEIIDREHTNSIKYDFREVRFGRSDILPLWVADMDFRTPDFIIEALRKRLDHEILGYSTRGEGFFSSIIDWYQRRYGWAIEKDWIISTPGVVPAIHFAIRSLSSPGDQVVIQPPVYHPFFSLVRGNGRRLLENPLKLEEGRYTMDLDPLEEQVDEHTRLFILCHPHNPVGRVWSEQELENLGRICLEKNMVILSDEIHSDLVFKPAKHRPMASLGEALREQTITFAAPSKTFNLAGMNTSYVIIPDERLRKKYNRELETSHLWLGNIFGSVALEAAYRSGDSWLEELLDYLKGNLEFVKAYLRQHLPEIKLIEPEATYLVWLDMSAIDTGGREPGQFLVDRARLAMNDGPSFGQGGEGFQRLNIACPRALLEEAMKRLHEAVKK